MSSRARKEYEMVRSVLSAVKSAVKLTLTSLLASQKSRTPCKITVFSGTVGATDAARLFEANLISFRRIRSKKENEGKDERGEIFRLIPESSPGSFELWTTRACIRSDGKNVIGESYRHKPRGRAVRGGWFKVEPGVAQLRHGAVEECEKSAA